MNELTREQILSMSVEEISITVAEKIFDAMIVRNEDYETVFVLVGNVGREHIQPLHGMNWHQAKWRNSEEKAWLDCPRFAENMTDAYRVEEKIKWMASTEGRNQALLIGHYMTELLMIVGNRGFDYVHASPEQRCKAALLAVMGL